jgi:hypothetical protein
VVKHVRTKRHRKSEKSSAEPGRNFIESENHQSQSGNDQKESVRNPEESSHSQDYRRKSKENSFEAKVTSVLFARHKHAFRTAGGSAFLVEQRLHCSKIAPTLAGVAPRHTHRGVTGCHYETLMFRGITLAMFQGTAARVVNCYSFISPDWRFR